MGIRKSTHNAKELREHDLESLKAYDELRVKQQRKLEEVSLSSLDNKTAR